MKIAKEYRNKMKTDPYPSAFIIFLTDLGRAFALRIINECEQGKSDRINPDNFTDRAKRKIRAETSDVSGVRLVIKVDDIRTNPITLQYGGQHTTVTGKIADLLRQIIDAQIEYLHEGRAGKMIIQAEFALSKQHLTRDLVADLKSTINNADLKSMTKTIQNTISNFKNIIKGLLSKPRLRTVLKKSIIFNQSAGIVIDTRLIYFQTVVGPKRVPYKDELSGSKKKSDEETDEE
jgi:hypothetical protein